MMQAQSWPVMLCEAFIVYSSPAVHTHPTLTCTLPHFKSLILTQVAPQFCQRLLWIDPYQLK